jgi:L-fuculose-phosphate aldolase
MSSFLVRTDIVETILKYADRLSRRGWVTSTLGTIAIIDQHPHGDVIYTKRKGVSLEEMAGDDVAITDMVGTLLHGKNAPSIGHQLNRAIFRNRPDIHAVIHVHVSSAIALCMGTGVTKFRFISDEAPLVLGKPIYILDAHVNVEVDTALVPRFIKGTNCFIMPNHGITVLGRHVSEAYNRLTTCVAEIERVSNALLIGKAVGHEPQFVSDDEEAEMFASSESVIYGGCPEARVAL